MKLAELIELMPEGTIIELTRTGAIPKPYPNDPGQIWVDHYWDGDFEMGQS